MAEVLQRRDVIALHLHLIRLKGLLQLLKDEVLRAVLLM